MPYSYQVARNCRGCGREREPDERFSARGKCADCRVRRMVDNVCGLHGHTGPEFLRWRRSVAASVGGILLEDIERDQEDTAA